MRDQAEGLRNLVQRAGVNHSTSLGPAPPVLVLTGAQAGCGVTSIAMSLSLALAQSGTRLVLVDGNSHHPTIAEWCGVESEPTLVEVFQSGRSIHEVLQLGPFGVQVVAGSTRPITRSDQPEKALQRCMHQIRSLGKYTDMIVIDAGSRGDADLEAFWQNANRVVVVTTPEPAAIMDCYAAIKTNGKCRRQPAVSILVNQVSAGVSPQEVHHRIDTSCRKFLHHSVDLLGAIPWNENGIHDLEPHHFSNGEDLFDARALDQIVQTLAGLTARTAATA